MANTWGESGTTWSQGDWGQQNVTTVVISGLSITSTLNSDGVVAFNEQGWGRDTWGDNAWGENAITVIPDGLEMTGLLGPGGWGIAPWEEQVSWGGDLSLQTTQLSIAALTGIEATGSLGTPQINYDFKVTLTDSLLGTLSLGTPTVSDMVIGVSGYAITASLGNVTEVVTALPSGYSATMSLGAISITSNPLVVITATNLVTGSLGSVTITDMSIGVSGYSITGSLGSMTVTDMQIGVSGFEITATLNSTVSPLHYRDDTITGSTSYTSVDITGSTSYTVDTHAG
jgi:hypothetical protein